ncbi:aminocyclopropane-1-carboxylate deaminase/D-cysteine desulfhydrase family protein, partial [Burkholderia sp. Tr-862]|nr:aminocyclopropane-1-carboxylate deaminase/D-cysteine desulfhydrase family protein [Burkholderia sp. Tr-862]
MPAAPERSDLPPTAIRSLSMNLQRFPRYPLTFGPTPIQPLKRL